MKNKRKKPLEDNINAQTPLYNASVQWFNDPVSPSDNEYLNNLWKEKTRVATIVKLSD